MGLLPQQLTNQILWSDQHWQIWLYSGDFAGSTKTWKYESRKKLEKILWPQRSLQVCVLNKNYVTELNISSMFNYFAAILHLRLQDLHLLNLPYSLKWHEIQCALSQEIACTFDYSIKNQVFTLIGPCILHHFPWILSLYGTKLCTCMLQKRQLV